MEMERRDFLKTGAVALGAASLGAMAAGVIQKSAVAEAAEAPDYKVYALKYAGPFTSSVSGPSRAGGRPLSSTAASAPPSPPRGSLRITSAWTKSCSASGSTPPPWNTW